MARRTRNEVYIYIKIHIIVFIYGHASNTRLHTMHCALYAMYIAHLNVLSNSTFPFPCLHMAKCTGMHLYVFCRIESVDFSTSRRIDRKTPRCVCVWCQCVNVIKFSVNYIILIIITGINVEFRWNNFVVVGNHYHRHQIELLDKTSYTLHVIKCKN